MAPAIEIVRDGNAMRQATRRAAGAPSAVTITAVLSVDTGASPDRTCNARRLRCRFDTSTTPERGDHDGFSTVNPCNARSQQGGDAMRGLKDGMRVRMDAASRTNEDGSTSANETFRRQLD
jgi:hypothetical protein